MSSEAATAPEPVLESRALARRAVLLVGLALPAAAAVVWLPALDPVRHRFANTDARWVVVAFALQVVSVLSFVAAFRGAFERRIRWRAAFDLAMVEEGANVLLPDTPRHCAPTARRVCAVWEESRAAVRWHSHRGSSNAATCWDEDARRRAIARPRGTQEPRLV